MCYDIVINNSPPMSFIPIKPVAPYIHVRVPVPTDYTIKTQKYLPSTVKGLENLVVKSIPELTILESERIIKICSFYSGMMTADDPKTGQTINVRKNFSIPKIVQVVKDNEECKYQEGQFLVLTHWTNMSDVVLDKEMKYMYILIEQKYISGVVEKQEDGEAIFKSYLDNVVEDTLENIESRVAEIKAIDEQQQADMELKASAMNSPRGSSNANLAGRPPTPSGFAPNSGIQFVVPKV